MQILVYILLFTFLGSLLSLIGGIFLLFKKQLKIRHSPAWFRVRYYKLRARAKKKGLEFDLLFEEFKRIKSIEKCYYCNMNNQLVTIDRMNNKLGYSKDNCINCCFLCNQIKSNIFNISEMKIIGKALKLYKLRVAT